jgi:hypothetical protein
MKWRFCALTAALLGIGCGSCGTGGAGEGTDEGEAGPASGETSADASVSAADSEARDAFTPPDSAGMRDALAVPNDATFSDAGAGDVADAWIAPDASADVPPIADAYGGCPCDGPLGPGDPNTTCPLSSPTPAATGASPVAVDRWMEQGADALTDRPLAEVILPGTHDSATYGLIDTTSRPAGDPFAPDANSVLVQLGSLVNITQAWSKTQDRSIADQLADGIRTVDLRVCMDKSGTFRLCHGMYGPQLADVLTDIGSFAASHPKEIVVLFVAGFTDWTPVLPDGGPDYGNMSQAHVDAARAMIASALAPWLLDHGAFTAMTSLGTMWATQPGRTIAVVFERSPSAPVWGDDRRTGSWADTWHEDEKKASLESTLSADTSRCPHCTLFEFSGEVTDDATLIEASLLPGASFPKTLRDLADAANPVILGWVRDEFVPAGRRVNALQIDFYDRACLVPFALSLNGVPGPSLDGCAIGAGTSWGSWWDESLGSACVTDAQCASGHCAAVCVACKSNADCASGHVCLGATCL